MQSQDIPRSQWTSFLQGFTDQHRDGLVNLRLLEAATGDESEASRLELRLISFHEIAAGRGAIRVELGHEGRALVTQTVMDPERVRLRQSNKGGADALAIESAKGTVMLMRFIPRPRAKAA